MLRELQDNFEHYILHGEAPAQLLAEIVGPHKLEKLNIYYNNVISNCIDALKIIYPNTIILVGEGYFDFIAKQFVINNMPQKASFLEYGKDFAKFLSGIEQLNQYPFVPQFAHLEWLMHLSHHGKAANTLEVTALQNSEVLANPKLVSSEFIIQSDWDLIAIHDACLSNIANPDNLKRPSHILISRPNWEVKLSALTISEYEFLSALQKQISPESIMKDGK
jgi:hypothetical protein